MVDQPEQVVATKEQLAKKVSKLEPKSAELIRKMLKMMPAKEKKAS